MENSSGPVVSIARTREKHLSFERVLDLVRRSLDRIGGIRSYVRPGQTVLLKPNQTVFYTSDEGCTTDPLVVERLGVRVLRLEQGCLVPSAVNQRLA